MSRIPDLEWTDLDRKAVDTVRVLAMDAVQKVGNGHPGTAMSLAPVAYTLFQKVMRHDPADPDWIARDRFVLSCGHTSLTLYLQLYLGGWGLELEDIKGLRTWGSKTPGHPEHGHTAGVETTTGPLGQGIGNAVGMAMAARRERGLLDPDAAPGESLFDHQVYCLASDGDIEEGVSSEASAIAGVQQLGNLTLIYDDNQISIEGETDIALGEDVAKRYEAYGWHVQTVDWRGASKDDGQYDEDVPALHDALRAAEAVMDQPSLIVVRTIIAWPAPNAQGTGKSHGSALGEEEVAATKEILGWDSARTFEVPDDVITHTRGLLERGAAWGKEWDQQYDAWAQANPERAALLHRMKDRTLPDDWDADLPSFDADPKGVATRKASGQTINAIAPRVPELWGGSADLAESNNTTIEDAPSFLPAERSTKQWQGDPLAGRVLHFGIREHAMGSIMNGIALHGGTRVFGGTFLTFSDYMRPAVRLASLMKLPVTYVWTHDSIGLGEDGPTHQPIEHLAALRTIPGLEVVRPGDANEVVACWAHILRKADAPAGLCLSRQNLPVFPRGTDESGRVWGSAEDAARGGYVLLDVDRTEGGLPDVVLIGTGSEVQIAVAARELLAADGIRARVVSMPCREWFEAEDESYRDSVIPPLVKARVSVEAGVAQGWREVVGDHGRIVSIETYGASAAYQRIYEEYGMTAETVARAARDSVDAARAAVAGG
ncbi:MAG TPA: transketolase [Nocardioides sp.]|nr:transketolase [Nocardioides sp.]